MKKNLLFIFTAILLVSCSSDTDSKDKESAKFTVYGNCGMCKKTIESSLDGIDGVIEADWNVKTDEMTVSFNSEEITLDKIKEKIASVGYDSDSHRAKDEVYENLHSCCKYERPE
ncbi:MAG: heavy-metal-associated domain-containing protein [Crocinitomicaceae bacterium]|nr:heavy-metal-associated domain-containing protein [Crocinitomicaceae bacterium]